MNIMVVNDDGIRAEGIKHLAQLAKKLGKVTVVSPLHQCSGMSHKISFEQALLVRKAEFPVKEVEAYSVDGTPADCVRVGMEHIMKEKPDLVFSGINKGYNIGYEIMYSGTVGAAMESLVYGVPAFAFSQDNYDDFSVIDTYFDEIIDKLLHEEIGPNQIWNINFPNCSFSQVEGIAYDCVPEKAPFYHDYFEAEHLGKRMFRVTARYGQKTSAAEGTDMNALLHHFISVGKITSMV